jgi:hypothetical protein
MVDLIRFNKKILVERHQWIFLERVLDSKDYQRCKCKQFELLVERRRLVHGKTWIQSIFIFDI